MIQQLTVSLCAQLQLYQILRGMCKYNTSVGSDRYGILNPDASETGHIDTGLNGEYHTLLNNSLTSRRNHRLFMNFKTDTMSQAVDVAAQRPRMGDRRRVAAAGEEGAGRLLEVPAAPAGPPEAEA